VRNSPLLPFAALLIAVLLVLAALVPARSGPLLPLSELQLGAIGVALTLAVFGVQGLLSVAIEGQELHPGLRPPQLTGPLSTGIVLSALLLLLDALILGYGIVAGWDTVALGIAGGVGCLLLAAILIFYKEAFLGDEASFDDREDGVPW
jgi:hypothetical protein